MDFIIFSLIYGALTAGFAVITIGVLGLLVWAIIHYIAHHASK